MVFCFGLWFIERGVIYLKRGSGGLWLTERGMLHLKSGCFGIWLKTLQLAIGRIKDRRREKNCQRAFPLVLGDLWCCGREQHGGQFAVWLIKYFEYFSQICDILWTLTAGELYWWRRNTKILQLWLYFWGFFSGLAVFFDEFCNQPQG